jgi:hypothetical protein
MAFADATESAPSVTPASTNHFAEHSIRHLIVNEAPQGGGWLHEISGFR